MKIITLPAGIEVLALDQITDLIADALSPIESDDAEGLGYKLLRIDVDKEVTQDARAGLLPIRHPLTRKLQTTPTPTADILDRLFQPTPFDVRYGVVLVADAAAYVAERGISLLVQTTDQTEAVKPASDAPKQSPATPAPVEHATETKEQRQDRRLKACIDAGLPMNTKAALIRLPDGVGDVADREGVTRQAFSTDVKAALKLR